VSSLGSRCYRWITAVRGSDGRIHILLGRRGEPVFAVDRGEELLLVFAEEVRFLRAREVLGKPCIEPRELVERAAEVLRRVEELTGWGG